MKASELIARLVEAIAEDGDVEVWIHARQHDPCRTLSTTTPVVDVHNSHSGIVWIRDRD